MTFGRVGAHFWPEVSPERYERPRLEKRYIIQRKLTREIDSKAPKLKSKNAAMSPTQNVVVYKLRGAVSRGNAWPTAGRP